MVRSYNCVMGVMAKSLIFLLTIAAIGGFVVTQIPSLKERVIEAVNPAAKEGRLLGELRVNLDEIDKSLNEAAQQKETEKIQEKISDGKDLLEKSKNLLGEVSKTNQDTGVIGSQVGKIINAISGDTSKPADYLQTPRAQTGTSSAPCTPE